MREEGPGNRHELWLAPGGLGIYDLLLTILDCGDCAKNVGVFSLTCGRCGGQCRFRGQNPGCEEKAMRVIWKQDPKAGISGNRINRSWTP